MSMRAQGQPAGLDYFLLVLLSCIWGGSFTLTAIALVDFPPATLSMVRLFIGAFILGAIAFWLDEGLKVSLRTLGLLALVGLLGNAAPFALIAWGQETVDAGLAAILMGIMPLATLVLAHFFTSDEPMTLWKLVGVCVGLFGLVVLVGPSVIWQIGDDGIRQIAILGAAISYGINAIVTKQLLDQPRRAAGAGLLLAGALWLVPIALIFEQGVVIEPTGSSIGALVMLAIFPTAIAALLMFVLLERQGAGFFSQINLLVPLAGVFWAVMFLNEALDTRALIAMLIILSGVAVSRVRTAKPAS